jgi:Spy/CpxP family protein refolding chaperone
MKITHKFLVSAALVTATLAGAGAVLAHQGPGMDGGAGHGQRGHEGRGGPGHGMGGAEDAAAVSARLDALKTKLNITAAQDAAWQRYTGLVKQQAQARDEMRKQMQAQMQAQTPQGATPAPAPDRSAQHEAMRKARDEQRGAHEAARKDLLAALTPEQRSAAEEALRGGRGHGRGMAHRGQGAERGH